MPINSRQKGAAAEREVAALLGRFGFPSHRSGQYQSGGTRARGEPDVTAEGLPVEHHFEVKRVEALNVGMAYRQAVDSATEGMSRRVGGGGAVPVPAVVHRRSRSKWLVTLGFEDYLFILGRLKDAAGKGDG